MRVFAQTKYLYLFLDGSDLGMTAGGKNLYGVDLSTFDVEGLAD